MKDQKKKERRKKRQDHGPVLMKGDQREMTAKRKACCLAGFWVRTKSAQMLLGQQEKLSHRWHSSGNQFMGFTLLSVTAHVVTLLGDRCQSIYG